MRRSFIIEPKQGKYIASRNGVNIKAHLDLITGETVRLCYSLTQAWVNDSKGMNYAIITSTEINNFLSHGRNFTMAIYNNIRKANKKTIEKIKLEHAELFI